MVIPVVKNSWEGCKIMYPFLHEFFHIYCVYLQNITISSLRVDFLPKMYWILYPSLGNLTTHITIHISIPLMFHDLMIICGIFVPLLATKPIITSRVMPGLVSSKVQGIIPITYLALRAICCRVHYCIMHKDKVKRTNRLNLMVQAKLNQGSGLQSAICEWFFWLIWWSSTTNPAATLVESAWDIPYLNRKISLFHILSDSIIDLLSKNLISL